MNWKPDRHAKKAIYKQLAEYMEKGIADGTFPPDKPLPSERYLANTLQVNRSTVVSAYDELEAMGLIERNRGSGTTISKDIWGITRKRIPSWNRYIEAGSFLPNLPVTQKIRKEAVDHKLINLATGELSEDLFPKSALREITATRSFIGSLGYDHPQGSEILRTTLANHIKTSRGIDTNPSSILITSGAQQALHLIVQCLLKPGDAVAIEDPSYNFNLPIFKSAGLKIHYLPVHKDGINPDDLQALYKKHRIKMIFLNPDFHNPTGSSLNIKKREAILDISSKLGIPVVEDDPYSLTAFSGEKRPTLKSLDTNGNVLYISSLSKIVASGLRIGWIIGPTSVIERLSDAKQQIDFGHSSFTQWIANDFLQSSNFNLHIEHLVKELERRRDTIVQSLHTYLKDEVTFYAPQGGIHIWCQVMMEDYNETQLLEESIQRGVIYVPGSTMGSQKGFVRFTYAREDTESIDEGIKRFAEALHCLNGKR
ncbi:PLP-dependent aminotransferase family protein [Lysinibacillus sphaericus]|uniref:Transcriptional regulator, GntR family, aminotransferase class I domain n=3 Tax=Lysinibacillus TaxID=400634 RepID=B1HNA8_LYSSC|nr:MULTISPECIES: PLP-dependent aminotransferase family protein [Lysinibacillus]MBE5083408.1 PLP-dependent aminotransferase family protein [Bacillus thuringiensis]ACA40418.1 transcriptional regulator, GntR family, aminotransferase class I domain [Lysinibacillus sphaericus C3-41]AMO33561.1 GntR family transcriptional regulator [Lysinibacillus sphaericus]AMR91332.1 GntR family transcriptional regulator [Lysinibacillus sphaericus]ANA45380.1 GntR family transcriptional regulator [Lysinibacillus sph